MEECVITQIIKPEFDDIFYYFGDEKVEVQYSDFVSEQGDECNYYWTYTAEFSNSDDLEDAIKSDMNAKTFEIEATSGQD